MLELRLWFLKGFLVTEKCCFDPFGDRVMKTIRPLFLKLLAFGTSSYDGKVNIESYFFRDVVGVDVDSGCLLASNTSRQIDKASPIALMSVESSLIYVLCSSLWHKTTA